MHVDVAAEVAACLKNAPDGTPTAEGVRSWLFDSRGGVGVRVHRILQDEVAREALAEAAGRSWRQCTADDSEAQRLWRDLGESFGRLAAEDDRASVLVGPFPSDQVVGLLPTELTDGSRTVRSLAQECQGFCRAPLLTPSDLICPFPAVSAPYHEFVREWQDDPNAMRLHCNLRQVAVGDFLPASAVLRLRLLADLRSVLRSEWTRCSEIDREYVDLDDRMNAVHGQVWAAPDAEARDGAMALLQVYLAGAKLEVMGLMGYTGDWSVLPAEVPTLLDIKLYREKESDRRIQALGLPPTFSSRYGRLRYVIDEAVNTRPAEVVKTVKAGLRLLDAMAVRTAPPPVGTDTRPGKAGWPMSADAMAYRLSERRRNPPASIRKVVRAIEDAGRRPGALEVFREHIRAVLAARIKIGQELAELREQYEGVPTVVEGW